MIALKALLVLGTLITASCGQALSNQTASTNKTVIPKNETDQNFNSSINIMIQDISSAIAQDSSVKKQTANLTENNLANLNMTIAGNSTNSTSTNGTTVGGFRNGTSEHNLVKNETLTNADSPDIYSIIAKHDPNEKPMGSKEGSMAVRTPFSKMILAVTLYFLV